MKSLRHYAPPKWDAKSKIVREDVVEYFLTGDKLVVNNAGMKIILNESQLKAEVSDYEKLLKK